MDIKMAIYFSEAHSAEFVARFSATLNNYILIQKEHKSPVNSVQV